MLYHSSLPTILYPLRDKDVARLTDIHPPTLQIKKHYTEGVARKIIRPKPNQQRDKSTLT